MISVDTKKKELVGPTTKQRAGNGSPPASPSTVKVHDFADKRARQGQLPYGVYDVAANTGWVNGRHRRTTPASLRGGHRSAAGGTTMGATSYTRIATSC